MEFDTLTFYRGLLSRQWRWRFQARGNGRKLANGGESYTYQNSAIQAALKVCHLPNPFVSIADADVDTLITRGDETQVMVRFRR